MTRSLKIVFIGAGSVSFGPSVLGDLFSLADRLRGSQVWLVDVNEPAVLLMAQVAARANDALGHPFALHHTTARTEALPGADFVIVSAAVDRLATWRLDWQIPLKHGVRHVLGENGGPGGLSHALRSIPLVLDIARDVQTLCPNALLINFTNPVSRVCLALSRRTGLRFVGLCHQIDAGYRLVNRVLGLVSPDGKAGHGLTAEIEQKMHLTAAGLNHFTFILEMRERESGRDLYPEFRDTVKRMPPDFELMSRRLLDTYGLFCAVGDLHAGEYVGFAHETIPLIGYDFDAYERRSREQWARLQAIARGEAPIEIRESRERVAQIIDAVAHDLNRPELAVNIRNDGWIANLPVGAVVEIPGLVNAAGVHGVPVGELPAGLAALMRREIDIQELVVTAAVEGDRRAALQALLLDPHIHAYAQAEHLLDDLLRAHAKYLPQFA